MKKKAEQVYVAWAAFQRRQESMQRVAGFDCWFYPLKSTGRVAKFFSYISLFFKCVFDLLGASPQVVWVQLPQVPALWAALVYRVLAKHPVKVVADCHNAQLRRPWCVFPFFKTSLKKSDAILVHNKAMSIKAGELGWPMHKLFVIEDVPACVESQVSLGLALKLISLPKPWILFPGSFAKDEPISEVLAAASLLPAYTFIITGRPEKAKGAGHNLERKPANVLFPGFLPLDVFDDLLNECDVVMGLTREEGIQLSVCNEALGFGKPLVTSNTKILSELFGEAAVLVDSSSPQSIAEGCKQAFEDRQKLAVKCSLLAKERLVLWERNQLAPLVNLISIK